MDQNEFFDFKCSLVMEEWKLANSNIGRLDGIVFTIRGWAITAATAAIAYAYSKPDPKVCLLILFPIFALWLVDALFKRFQRVFITRSKEIESYLSSPEFEEDFAAQTMANFTTPSISERFGQGNSSERIKSVLKHAILRNVLVTYLPLVLFSLIAYLAA